jgi:glycosyltransferase involved in cell wall biosynthesis
MRILFVARTYPPVVGGLEKFAKAFYENYRRIGEIDLLANPGGRRALLPFLLKTAWALALNSRRYDVVHFGDGSLSILLPFVRLRGRARVSCSVHGLDVVYSKFGYQWLIPFFLRRCDRVFALSRYTLEQCEARGVAGTKLTVIPPGVALDEPISCAEAKRAATASKFSIPEGKIILLTVGRLVRRKGHAWFLKHVMPKLPDRYHYLVVGSGPEREPMLNLAQELGISERVQILEHVSEEERDCIYKIADLFIMPNVLIEHDPEGFGIVILEAGYAGLPVIASNIEGIRDAVIVGKTGVLVHEKDAAAFVDAILNSRIDRSGISEAVASTFDLKDILRRYNEGFVMMAAQ